jgi:hypothetical protein
MMRFVLFTAIILTAACAPDKDGRSPDTDLTAVTSSVVDTIAAAGKSEAYISQGSFRGGEITDGRDVHGIEWSAMDGFERVEIRIHQAVWGGEHKAPPVAIPCWFKVTREHYPARLVIVFGGTRMFSASPPRLNESDLVLGFHRIIFLDDSGSMCAFEIESESVFEVFELHEPARIVIDIKKFPGGASASPDTVFSLRSASWPLSERLGHMQEHLGLEGASKPRIILDDGGEFCVEEGYYPTRLEAEGRRKIFTALDIELHIEARGPEDRPRNIPPGME